MGSRSLYTYLLKETTQDFGITAADDGLTFDVMVVYTPAARAGAGGTTAMNALINLAVAETNTAYLRSGVFPRLRLVHTEEVAYTESGNFSTDLNRLTEIAPMASWITFMRYEMSMVLT